MRLRTLTRLTRLFLGLTRPVSKGRPPGVLEERSIGIPFTSSFHDLYAPRGRSIGTIAAVHGVSVNGGRDPRLVRFARFMAECGVTCLVPTLGGLAECRWDDGDIEALGHLVGTAPGPEIGLVGFSWGGSYSLVAAGREEWADKVRFVLSVGAYYCLADVLVPLVKRQKDGMKPELDRDAYIYERLVLAYQNRKDLGLGDGLAARIRSLLERYSHGASDEEKWEFHERHLGTLEFGGDPRTHFGMELLGALSPAGRMSGIRCPVNLIHGSGDKAVPPSEAHRLYEEISSLPHGDRHTLLVTSLLSHVSLAGLARPSDIRALYSAFAPLLESVRGAPVSERSDDSINP